IREMEERRVRLGEESESVEAQLSEKRAAAKESRRALEAAEEEAAAIRNIIEGHTLKMAGRKSRAAESEEQRVALTMEKNNLDSRIHTLSELEKEYEGFNKAVRVVMQAAEKNALRGIHGPVANLITVDKKYAVAIEIALGAGMQNIVVDREEDGKSAINYLKNRDGGRATFLPLSAIRGETLKNAAVSKEYGYVGIASELVQFEAKYKDIFENLLGRTVIVEDMDCGIPIARKFQNAFRIVTLDGQVLNRGGSMTGGSVSKSAGILSRANQLKELTERRERVEEKLAAVTREADEAKRDLTAAQYELDVAASQQREAEDAVLRLRGDKEHFDILLGAMRERSEAIEDELASITQRTGENRKKIEEKMRLAAQQDAEAAQYRAAAEEKLSGQSEALRDSTRLSETISEHKSALAGIVAECETMESALRQLRELASQMEGDELDSKKLIEQYRAASEAARERIVQFEAICTKLRAEADARAAELSALVKAKMDIEAERTRSERQTRESNELYNQTQMAASKLESKRSNIAMEEKVILDKLWETYELSHSAALEQRIELESVAKASR
ncbi:MAG: chromosome segregation protein SMC, partial [Oscillospiraceae bacterium]|nr:chromosome segregation protein SMC [Oscillospiraceae bacterium]